MNKTLFLFALLSVGLVSVGAMAMPLGQGFFGNKGSYASQGQTQEMKDMQQALESGNLATWKAAVIAAATAHANAVTQDDFQKMVDNSKQMAQKRADMDAKMAPVNAAIAAGDYTAWKAAVASSGMPAKMTDKITEANFPQFVQLEKAKQAGDMTTVKTLATQLGLNAGFNGMGKDSRHMNMGQGFQGSMSQGGQGHMSMGRGRSHGYSNAGWKALPQATSPAQ